MDVKMPDGTVIANVPDGITQAQLMVMVNKSKLKQPDVWKQTAQAQSGMDNFLSGVGGAFEGVKLGLKQVLPFVEAPSEQEIAEYKAAMRGLGTTKSGTAGQFVGAAIPAAAASIIPGANTLAGAALVSGGLGALEPVAENESRLRNAGISAGFGVMGQGIANTVGRAIKPVQSTLDPAADALAQKAKTMGIELNAAQQTGSKPLRWIDSALDNLPITSERQAVMKGQQRSAWESQLVKQIGENADVPVMDALASAKQRFTREFADVANRNTVQLGNDFLDAIARIESSKTPFSKGLDSVVDNALELAAKGRIGGKEYQNVRTSLTNASQGAWQTNPELATAYKSLIRSLDDAAEASMSAADQKAWAGLRDQYKAFKAVSKSVDPTTGMVSPKKLVNELGRKNPNGMIYGLGDQTMPTIAKVGKRFIAENLPSSGTAERSWYMNLLQNPTSSVGGVLGALGGGPVGALAGVAAGAATPLAAHKALWSPNGYLVNGLLNPSENMKRAGNAAALGIPMGLLDTLQ